MSPKLLASISGQYPAEVLLQFVKTLPPPDMTKYRFYPIKSSDRIPLSVWGLDVQDVLLQFDDFIKLLIFA